MKKLLGVIIDNNLSWQHHLESFLCTFSNIINTHLPHVTKRIKRPKQPPWITKDILLAMNKRDNSKKKNTWRMYIDTGGTRPHI